MDSGDRQLRRVFQNGHGEWIRWGLSMVIGAAVLYGVFTTRLTAVEQQLSGLTQDIRELRTEMLRRAPGGGGR